MKRFRSGNRCKRYIGHGSYGSVYEIHYKGVIVALKKTHSGEHEKEVAILKSLKHENVVAYITELKSGIMMECMTCNLREYIHKKVQNQFISKCSILEQLVNGLDYIHMKNVIHCDLTPSNILMKGISIKISDFGKSNFGHKTKFEDLENIGTIEYMAPEVIKGGECTEKIDIFSLGVIFWEMFEEQIPFKDFQMPFQIITDVLKNGSDSFKNNLVFSNSCSKIRDLILII